MVRTAGGWVPSLPLWPWLLPMVEKGADHLRSGKHPGLGDPGGRVPLPITASEGIVTDVVDVVDEEDVSGDVSLSIKNH